MPGKFTSGERRGALMLAGLLVVSAAVVFVTKGYVVRPAPSVVIKETVEKPRASHKAKTDTTKTADRKRRKQKDKKVKPQRTERPARSPLDEPISQ